MSFTGRQKTGTHDSWHHWFESNTAPLEPFDDSVERFFASLRFEQRGKLDDFGIQLGNSDEK
jgi:hypothetical protein